MTLEKFDKQLRSTLAAYVKAARKAGGKDVKKTYLRPFVCDGNPLDCEVMIVGLNPASKVKNGFWKFWDLSKGGFDRAAFETHYAKLRRRAGKKNKSTTREKISCIETHVRMLRPKTKFLEANLYPWPETNETKLSEAHRAGGEALFSLLCECIQPKLIVTHHRYFKKRRKFAALLPEDGVLKYGHFGSRGEKKCAEEIANEIFSHIENSWRSGSSVP